MHDDPESAQNTPKSSSSSAPSGTQALRVTFVAAAAQADMAAPEDIPAPAAPESAAVLADAGPETLPLLVSPDASAELVDAAPLPMQDEAPDLAPTLDVDFASAPEPSGAHSGEALVPPEQASMLVDADVPPVINGNAEPEPQPVSPFANGTNGETPGAYHQTTERLSGAVLETMSGTGATQERSAALYGQVSQNLGVLMDDARQDAVRFGHKLMEFVQANVDSGMVLAKDYADARSVPDLFSVQAAYFKRQLDLINRQSEELRALTRELASKNAERLQLRPKA
jgi:hypothetical protein